MQVYAAHLQVCIQIRMQVYAAHLAVVCSNSDASGDNATLQIKLEAMCFDLLRQLIGNSVKMTRLLEGIREKEGEKGY